MEKQASLYDETILHFTLNATYRVGNYLQSWKYFQEASAELRQQLVFRDPLKINANMIIDSILHPYNKFRRHVTLIVVHIRRTDMVNSKNGYQVAYKKYFHTAMRLFENHLFPIFISLHRWSLMVESQHISKIQSKIHFRQFTNGRLGFDDDMWSRDFLCLPSVGGRVGLPVEL